MSKVPECDLCLFYSQNPHVICAVHPFGVDGNHCLDFRRDPKIEVEDEELWSPEGYSYYAGQLIKNPTRRLTPQQQLHIIDTHPFLLADALSVAMSSPRTTHQPFTGIAPLVDLSTTRSID